MLFAAMLVDGWANAKMEGWMESDDASGICSLGIHYLLQHTRGSSNPTSTGLFSHWASSGLKEDAPTQSTCKPVPRHVETATACCSPLPDVHYVHIFVDTHSRCNCLVTLDNVEGNALKSQLLTCTELVADMEQKHSRCVTLFLCIPRVQKSIHSRRLFSFFFFLTLRNYTHN